MAEAGKLPSPDPAAGLAALEADLPKVLRGRGLEEAGWFRFDPLTLLIPLFGRKADGAGDFYLLRMNFSYYPEWPPSCQFVNPTNGYYDVTKDSKWVPHIEDPNNEIAIHERFNNTELQLICCSATLEFYQVLHSVQPQHVWDRNQQNFAASLAAIRRALRPPFYKGSKQARS